MILKETIKHVLKENAEASDELNSIASEIIAAFAERNHPMMNRLAKRGFGTMMGYYFNIDSLSFGDIIKKDYKYLNGYEKQDVNILFKPSLGSLGIYEDKYKRITIKYTEGFKSLLEYNLGLLDKDPEDGSIKKEDAIIALRSSIGAAFRSTLLHELRHSYESFLSGGKYAVSKASRSYHKKYPDYDPFDENYLMTPEQRDEYLKIPHEYRARFAEALNEITDYKKPFAVVLSKFKGVLEGYEILGEKTQRRLIKNLYLYWAYKNNEIKR
jgi:hypothetical protein